jgi:amidohydrolase
MKNILLLLFFTGSTTMLFAQKNDARGRINSYAEKIEQQVILWREDFHKHPELANGEIRTSAIIAKHLESLGIKVQTGVAHTGVVGILVGGKPGPVVALRADMDALPVIERTPLPFASTVKTQYNGQEVGVMHACGHDAHVAILMGVAEILSSLKNELKGTIKFIFQPAEEGAPKGEEGGAAMMVKEGVLENPKVDVIFGLHIISQIETGKIAYRPKGAMAGVNDMQIIVKGKSSHGANPWSSVDPIVVAAEIINNLQTIISRNLNITENIGVVTIGSIHGGNRSNIIPEQVEMLGTIRSFSNEDEKMLSERIKQVATKTAESAGAIAEVAIPYTQRYPITYNDPGLTEKMLPSLNKTAGDGNLLLQPPVTWAEDFSFYQQKIPGLFIFLGGLPKGKDPKTAPAHHTPDFFIDEGSFKLGVKAIANLAVDYMEQYKKPARK